jgi:GAF domain-containing protein
LTAKVDPQAVVQELVEALPRLASIRFAALYLLRGDRLQRAAGPSHLPQELPVLPKLQRFLESHRGVTRLEHLGMVEARAPEIAKLVRQLESAGVEAIGDLASRRRWLGIVMLSAKEGELPLEPEELILVQGLLHQASLALETGLLLEERTERIELERELQIAARIQADLHPGALHMAEGWTVAAICRPARDIGGDFFTQLSGPDGSANAVVFGDVSGKSVSGALMMMAAHEALHALAMADPSPERLFD